MKNLIIKSTATLTLILLASMAHADVNQSVRCHIEGSTKEISKPLKPNEEGGLARAIVFKNKKFQIEAYSSDYRLDAGNRLFLTAGDVVVSEEAEDNQATINVSAGNLGVKITCKFN